MARVLCNGNNDLQESYLEYKKKSKRNMILLLISLVLFPFTGGLSMVFFIIFGLMLNKSNQKASSLSAGLEGETKSTKLLEQLPDAYCIIPGPRIEVDGRESEMDHVILGPNGIFVMETKNHNGYIKGSESDHELTQHKVGRKGGKYSKNFYNPVKQVNTHVYRLSQLLKNNGYRHWVQGMVLFTNNEAQVNVNSVKTPVLNLSQDGSKEVLDYITGYEAKSKLDQKELHKVAMLINQASKNGMDSKEFSQLLA